MSDPLRDRRPVRELAENRQVIEISEKIRDFDGLSAVVESDLEWLDESERPNDWRDLPVTGRIRFATDAPESGQMTLSGAVEATLYSVCQRCLKPFRWVLSAPLEFEFVQPEVAGSTGKEPWELADERICPLAIVDEALVMALPLAARHDEADAECVVIAAGEVPRKRDEKLITPFADLRAQMDRKIDK